MKLIKGSSLVMYLHPSLFIVSTLVKDSKLYVTVSHEVHCLRAATLDTCNIEVLYSVDDADRTNPRSPSNPVLYGDDLYWIMTDAWGIRKNVYKMPKSGGVDEEAVSKIDAGFDVQCLYIYHGTGEYEIMNMKSPK